MTENVINIRERTVSVSDDYTDTEDDDSGLVADAFDVLPDEDILEFDYDLDLDLSNENFGDYQSKPEVTNMQIVNNLKSETHKILHPINESYNSTQHLEKGKNGFTDFPQLPLKQEAPSKLITFNKEQARQWRRKRILNSQTNSKHQTCTKPHKLEPLLLLPEKLKPISSGKGKHLKTEKTSERKLNDPLLGGEKIRTTRGPMPMKLRALPESFWKEPSSLHTSSLAGSNYSILPPLFSTEGNHNPEEVMDVRPVTPPEEKNRSPRHSPRHKKKVVMTSPPDSVLLFSLFDHLDNRIDDRLIVKRGRPKKSTIVRIPPPPPRDKNDDPCIVDDLANKLFPGLSLNQKSGQEKPLASNFAIIRIGKGERTIEFPALQVEQNYPAILNELVTHM